jgi:type IV pilus assembly protein PilN
MTRINLLPWREARRRQQQRDFLIVLAAAGLVAALGVFLTNWLIDQRIAHQEARNEYLRVEITRLKKAEAEIKELDKVKARLLGRLTVIQNLQASRPGMVKVFDTLPRLLPENVYLTTIKTQGNQLTLKGIASSNNAISSFMRNLSESGEFGEPVLTVVETKTINEVRTSVFELVVSHKVPGQDQQKPEVAKKP